LSSPAFAGLLFPDERKGGKGGGKTREIRTSFKRAVADRECRVVKERKGKKKKERKAPEMMRKKGPFTGLLLKGEGGGRGPRQYLSSGFRGQTLPRYCTWARRGRGGKRIESRNLHFSGAVPIRSAPKKKERQWVIEQQLLGFKFPDVQYLNSIF